MLISYLVFNLLEKMQTHLQKESYHTQSMNRTFYVHWELPQSEQERNTRILL